MKVVEPSVPLPRYGPVAKEARKKERDDKDKAIALAAKQEAVQKAAAAKAAYVPSTHKRDSQELYRTYPFGCESVVTMLLLFFKSFARDVPTPLPTALDIATTTFVLFRFCTRCN